ncbi:MAG: thiolase family protein [Streptosporangiales bacterium]|nr:thiolase family protein [Streptosporangiales bacterium]
MTTSLLRDRTAIVGIGETDFGAMYRTRDPDLTPYDHGGEAFARALEDSGLRADEIDGLICARIPSYARMADVLGLKHPRVVNVFEGTGRMSGLALQTAVMAIATGQAEVVACVYGNDGRSAGARYGGSVVDLTGSINTAVYDSMHGMTSPGAYVAMMYRRYQYLYGAPDDALAPLAINNRRNGALNPNAVMRKAITYDEYLAARWITEPLRLFDYCLINDGGVALIITTAERARDLRKPPVYVSATATAGDLTNFYTSQDFFFDAASDVATRLYRAAGIERVDVDVLQVYDNFTPTILFSLEGMGFADRGEAWQYVRDGRIELGGALPVNTGGGHTAESYMQGWALHAEAVRQVRGEAGARQVKDCEVAQYVCLSPIVSSHIFRRDR